MMNFHFVLPTPSLSCISAARVLTIMWQRSLQKYSLPKLIPKNLERQFETMVGHIQLKHTATIIKFDSIAPHLKVKMLELDSQMAVEVKSFFLHNVPLELTDLLMKNIVFDMYGAVKQGASFRMVLHFINDSMLRFSIVAEYAMIDVLDDAWHDLPFSTVQKYMDLWKDRGSNWHVYYRFERAIEIYFVLLKMDKLCWLENALGEEHDEGVVAKYLFQTAVHRDLFEVAKYSLTKIPVAKRETLLSLLQEPYCIVHRRPSFGRLYRIKEFSEINNQLMLYSACLENFNKEGLLETIFDMKNCGKLFTPWMQSTKYLPLMQCLLYNFKDRMTLETYSEVLEAFTYGVRGCQMKKHLLIEVLDMFKGRFKPSLLDYKTMGLLCLFYDHDVVVKILSGSEEILTTWRLHFCKRKLVSHVSNHPYVYGKFLEDVVPLGDRQEFERLLELELISTTTPSLTDSESD